MGRETSTVVTFRGASGETKVLLEATELILRGGIKARFSRDTLREVCASPAGLTLNIAGDQLHLALSEAEAGKWAKAILTPPPSLAEKLGVGPDKPTWVLGELRDADLIMALDGATVANLAQATTMIAVIEIAADLAAVLAHAHNIFVPVWAVYPKGKTADPGDAQIRAAFRGAGWMDNKTSAVSDRLTATRYAVKR